MVGGERGPFDVDAAAEGVAEEESVDGRED